MWNKYKTVLNLIKTQKKGAFMKRLNNLKVGLIVDKYGKRIEKIVRHNTAFNCSCIKEEKKALDAIRKEERRIRRRYVKARNGLARIMALGQHKMIQRLIRNSIGEDKEFMFYGAGYRIGVDNPIGWGNVFICCKKEGIIIEYGSSYGIGGLDGVDHGIYFSYDIINVEKNFQQRFIITPSHKDVDKFQNEIYLDSYFKETSIDDDHEDSVNLLEPNLSYFKNKKEWEKAWAIYWRFCHEIKRNWHPRRIAFQVLVDCADDKKFERYLSTALKA